MRRALLLIAACALGLAGAGTAGSRPLAVPSFCTSAGPVGTAYQPGANCRSIVVDGAQRQFIVYVPAHPKARPAHPAVALMFHGSSGTAPQFLKISGWREKADETGLIAVFPQGAKYFVLDKQRWSTKWNSFGLENAVDLSKRPPGYPATGPWPADDVKYVNSLVADVLGHTNADPKRVYLNGFSNGGEFCARLAVEGAGRYRAAGCSSGGLDKVHVARVRIPVVTFIGSVDDRVLEQIPSLKAIPLDANELLKQPLLATFLSNHAASFGLANRFTPVGSAHQLELRFTQPLAGNGARNVYHFDVLDRVKHQYANGHNNPLHFVAADLAWAFYKKYAGA
jgi:polyhydroxybutyrate depolymerase